MNIRKQLPILAAMLFTGIVNAQVQHGGEPYQWLEKSAFSAIDFVSLPDVDIDALKAEDKVTEKHKDIPLRFAYDHEVSFDMNNSGSWLTTKTGDRIWRLGIESKGAYSLNVTFNNFELVEGSKLFIYNEDKTYKIGAFTHENNKSSGTLGTAPVSGDKIIVEYHEPAKTQLQSKLSIGHVAHDYKGVFKLAKMFGASGSCNNNVKCPISAGWEAQVSSVSLITLSNGTRWCTGSMVANTSGDDTPYFLTADHCIDGQNVTNWVFYFNYESPACSPNTDGQLNQSVSGSTLRANLSNTDFALLELSAAPPESYGVYYNGWDNSGATPSRAVAIHHPSGDVKKLSIENDALTSSGNYWTVNDWDDGTTEPGSSGSPLFDQNKRVVGQLFGGGAACGNNESDLYGKLSESWDGSSASVRLKDWLDPQNTGNQTHDGYYPGTSSLAEAPSKIDVTIFPNPSDGIFTVAANLESGATVNVLNSVGEVVFTRFWQGNSVQLDLSRYSTGIYFVEIDSNSGIIVKKVNKVR